MLWDCWTILNWMVHRTAIKLYPLPKNTWMKLIHFSLRILTVETLARNWSGNARIDRYDAAAEGQGCNRSRITHKNMNNIQWSLSDKSSPNPNYNAKRYGFSLQIVVVGQKTIKWIFRQTFKKIWQSYNQTFLWRHNECLQQQYSKSLG